MALLIYVIHAKKFQIKFSFFLDWLLLIAEGITVIIVYS